MGYPNGVHGDKLEKNG